MKVGVCFGGQSAEHEVSIISARNVVDALDKSKFEVVLIPISKSGKWYFIEQKSIPKEMKFFDDSTAQTVWKAEPALLSNHQSSPGIYILNGKNIKLDVVFPLVHGTFGEDGTMQGYLKMMGIPFVGCDVLASSLAMDKDLMKKVLNDAQIPTSPFLLLTRNWAESPEDAAQRYSKDWAQIIQKLGLPLFIKPSRAGSSVGVHKIKTQTEFQSLLADSFLYDFKVLAEKGIVGRELECSALGADIDIRVSLPAEVIPNHEFYSYNAKYLDADGAQLKIPADLTPQELKTIQSMAISSYKALNCEGLARIDFFLSHEGQVYINELNTIPGFTSISMYPKMWESSGLKYSDLLSVLIDWAIRKSQAESKLKTDFPSELRG
jgi:D-alanine-D-alanine ligase